MRIIHLLGVCGTGMGTLAAMLRDAGYQVRGSDQNVYPPMSTFLASRGIRIMEGYHPENLEPAPDLVVVGNVIRRDNPEVQAVFQRGLSYLSMPETLCRFFLNSPDPVVVAGTHGKTTTSALVTWILTTAGLDPGCLLGGLMVNFNRSYRLGRGPYFVVEGDEYDTAFFDKRPKFLHYKPKLCIITSVEFDHADIYPDLQAVKGAFRSLVRIIPPEGLLVVNADNPEALELSHEASCRVVTYASHRVADYIPSEWHYGVGQTRFQVCGPDLRAGLRLPLAGAHNLSNTLAAVALAHQLGLQARTLQQALDSFRGIRRRQEVRGEVGGVTVIDDFAHHPTEVQATIEALRPFYGNRRLWAIFEPRTNSSRRRVFQERYASAFDSADLVLIKEPVAMEGISQEERLSVKQLLEGILARGLESHAFAEVEEMLDFILSRVEPGDVLLIMSTGSFDNLHERTLEALRGRCRRPLPAP